MHAQTAISPARFLHTAKVEWVNTYWHVHLRGFHVCLLMPEPCNTSFDVGSAHGSCGGCSRTSGGLLPIWKLEVKEKFVGRSSKSGKMLRTDVSYRK